MQASPPCSTLLRARASPANDRLFDTLDTTTRRLKVSDHLEILLSDTVGFIAKLPHHLIEAFQATLEELQYADLLLHVIDASDPHREAHIEVVDRLIDKLAKPGVPVLRCYNKADLVGDVSNLPIGEKNIPMCARSGIGMDELLTRIEETLTAGSTGPCSCCRIPTRARWPSCTSRRRCSVWITCRRALRSRPSAARSCSAA